MPIKNTPFALTAGIVTVDGEHPTGDYFKLHHSDTWYEDGKGDGYVQFSGKPPTELGLGEHGNIVVRIPFAIVARIVAELGRVE